MQTNYTNKLARKLYISLIYGTQDYFAHGSVTTLSVISVISVTAQEDNFNTIVLTDGNITMQVTGVAFTQVTAHCTVRKHVSNCTQAELRALWDNWLWECFIGEGSITEDVTISV